MTESLNRAFLYGESVFTTMRMVEGRVRDWNLHFDRLRKGTEFLYGPFIDENWSALFKGRLEEKLVGLDGDKIIRLTIYREQARGLGRSTLISFHDLKIHCSATPFESTRVDQKMLKLRTCPANGRPHWWPPYLKAGNYLDTIISQKLHMKPGDDDVLFLSSRDTVLESSVANIFVVRHNRLYTAPTGPNVLEGIMRKKVLDLALEFFDEYEESETNMEQLLKADAVFGSNSVRGLFLVDRIDDYEITYGQDFLNKFSTLKERVFL